VVRCAPPDECPTALVTLHCPLQECLLTFHIPDCPSQSASMVKKACLICIDGWGCREDTYGNAIAAAATPVRPPSNRPRWDRRPCPPSALTRARTWQLGHHAVLPLDRVGAAALRQPGGAGRVKCR
jgi:hypothetical protein